MPVKKPPTTASKKPAKAPAAKSIKPPKPTASKASTAAGKKPLPAAFSPEGEGNRVLAKYKESLAKRFGLTKPEALEEALQLAWMLTALGRTDEALAVCHHLEGNVEFDDDYDVWTPVGGAIFLAARLHRERGDSAEVERLLARVRAHDTYVAQSKKEYQASVKESRDNLQEAADDSSVKWSLQGYAFEANHWCRWREAAGNGFSISAFVDGASVEKTIVEILAAMKKRLG